jgi:hypothetical protein
VKVLEAAYKIDRSSETAIGQQLSRSIAQPDIATVSCASYFGRLDCTFSELLCWAD